MEEAYYAVERRFAHGREYPEHTTVHRFDDAQARRAWLDAGTKSRPNLGTALTLEIVRVPAGFKNDDEARRLSSNGNGIVCHRRYVKEEERASA